MRLLTSRWALLPLIFACAMAGLTAGEAAAQSNTTSSWWPFNHPAPATPPPTPTTIAADDPLAVNNGPKKAGVEVYVALANFYVQTGKFTEAEDQYQQALKMAPSDVRVLLGYAILKDHINQPQEAMKLYNRAVEKHPKSASVYNDLAVHYARWDMNREAIEAARRAVELRPRESRYRNNLAALLVEAGRPQDAYRELREVDDEPVAHYDLGFLLHKRGMNAGALQEFTIALQLNPGMALARQWVERLSRERAEPGPAVVGTTAMPQHVPPQAPPVPTPSGPHEGLPPPPAAPMPPQYAGPPQYARPPQNNSPAEQPAVSQQAPPLCPPPVQAPYAVSPPLPVQAQNPAPVPPPQTQYAVQPPSPVQVPIPCPAQYAVQPAPPAQAQMPSPAPAPAQVQYAVSPLPVQVQDRASAPALAQVQYPAEPQQYSPLSAPQTGQQAARPQGPGQQIASLPQIEYPATPPPAGGNPPIMVARASQFRDARPLPPPAPEGNASQRLPVVHEVRDHADASGDQQGLEPIAPDPPGWRR